MKLQTLYKLLFVTFAIVLASCDDTLKELGFSIQPGKDGISVGTDTIEINAKTVMVNKIFAKTKNPVLGEYIDPIFGSIKSDYVAEFYIPENTKFPANAVIDSVKMNLSFLSWVGDSLAPMRLTAYEINKTLPISNFYTDFNPSGYYDSTQPLGSSTFSVKTSEHQHDPQSRMTRYVMDLELPVSLGERFLTNQDKLKDTETFRDLFKGLYVTTTFGTGTILNVEYSLLFVHYKYPGKTTANADTTFTGAIRLSVTPEVTQINRVQNQNNDLLTPNDNFTYLKSPAGVNTEIVFPFSQISNMLEAQALNIATFTVQAVPETNQNEKFKLPPPSTLLLINKDSLSGFFENRRMHNNITTFYAQLDTTSYTYNFGNISTMINHYKEKNNGKLNDLTYMIIPVAATYSTSQDYFGQTSSTISSISNLMTPSATVISKKPEDLRLELIFSKF